MNYEITGHGTREILCSPKPESDSARITFEYLCQLEPGLTQLLSEVNAVAKRKRGRFYCANDVWFTQFKPRLLMLVGWRNPNPKLGTPEAYEIAYNTLYQQLPACRRCMCA